MISHTRTCIGCRQRGERDELVRLAVRDGRVVVDGGRSLPGRGASLHRGPDCLALALKRRAIGRALPGAQLDGEALTNDAAFRAV